MAMENYHSLLIVLTDKVTGEVTEFKSESVRLPLSPLKVVYTDGLRFPQMGSLRADRNILHTPPIDHMELHFTPVATKAEVEYLYTITHTTHTEPH